MVDPADGRVTLEMADQSVRRVPANVVIPLGLSAAVLGVVVESTAADATVTALFLWLLMEGLFVLGWDG